VIYESQKGIKMSIMNGIDILQLIFMSGAGHDSIVLEHTSGRRPTPILYFQSHNMTKGFTSNQ